MATARKRRGARICPAARSCCPTWSSWRSAPARGRGARIGGPLSSICATRSCRHSL